MDDIVRLSVISRILRRRWRLLAALTLLGALVGVGASLLLSPGHVAGSKVLLQGTREEQEVLAEAQIATTLVVLDRAAGGLGWGVTGAELRGQVTAVVADGNVIDISGTAGNQDMARLLTERVTHEYVAFSAEIANDAANASAQVLEQRRAQLQERVDAIREQIAALQGSPEITLQTIEGARARAELDRLGTELTSTTGELEDVAGRTQEADAEAAASRAQIVVIESAVPRGVASPTLVELVAGGALVFPVLGGLGLLAAARADRRLRRHDEVAAALGAPVLAGAAVVVGPDGSPVDDEDSGDGVQAGEAADRRGRSRSWLRDLLRSDAAWEPSRVTVRHDRPYEDIRYRRVLERLRRTCGVNLRLVVLVADDDVVARRAVVHLAAAAAGGSARVAVVTDSPELARMAKAATRGTGTASLPVTVHAPSQPVPDDGRTVMHLVAIDAHRPTVPDCGPVSGALAVLSIGTRTAWELVGIAGACLDASHPLLGAIVVTPSLADPEDPPPGATALTQTNGSLMAGSS